MGYGEYAFEAHKAMIHKRSSLRTGGVSTARLPRTHEPQRGARARKPR